MTTINAWINGSLSVGSGFQDTGLCLLCLLDIFVTYLGKSITNVVNNTKLKERTYCQKEFRECSLINMRDRIK
jgi:hypothetical protein